MDLNLRRPSTTDVAPPSEPHPTPVAGPAAAGAPVEPPVGSRPSQPYPAHDVAYPYRPLQPLPEETPKPLPFFLQSKAYMLRLFSGIFVAFFLFYCLADYTAVSVGQIHPGELIFSNTMIQLWTATYRLVFIIGIVMALIALLSAKNRGLWQYIKPTPEEPGFDLAYSIKHDLSPVQRVWLFYAVFFFFCYLFVLLLTVKLPDSISATP